MIKLFFALLTTLFINNYVLCMKRPRNETPEEQSSKKICSFEQPSAEILISAFIDSFKTGDNSPTIVQNNIRRISLINKDFYHQINLPRNIRSIINFADSTNRFRGLLANKLTLPATKNYLQQSENLLRNINHLTHDQIRELVSAGADVNYCYFDGDLKYCYPALIHTRDDYGKTALLLELGADSNMTNGHFGIPSPFQYALSTENIKLIKLYLAYKPRLKHLCIAIENKNDEIIALILLDKNIPLSELNQALETVILKTFNLSHAKLLLDAGADPTPALNTIASNRSFSHNYDFRDRYNNKHGLDNLTLDMIDLLCTYGAYDECLYWDTKVNGGQKKYIDSLEKGCRIMLEQKKEPTCTKQPCLCYL